MCAIAETTSGVLTDLRQASMSASKILAVSEDLEGLVERRQGRVRGRFRCRGLGILGVHPPARASPQIPRWGKVGPKAWDQARRQQAEGWKPRGQGLVIGDFPRATDIGQDRKRRLLQDWPQTRAGADLAWIPLQEFEGLVAA